MNYEIFWADKKVQKAFQQLPVSLKDRAQEFIRSLSQDPRPKGVKKLSGKLKGVWRFRIRDYRLLYDIDDKKHQIILLDIGHRRQIYR